MKSVLQNAFHVHLDECKQCAESPFNLCRDGSRILHETVGCCVTETKHEKEDDKKDPRD